jgi:hypothetical protein
MQYGNQQCRKLPQSWNKYLGVANASGHGDLALPHPGHPGVAGACESEARPSGRDADGKRRTGKQARAGCGWKAAPAATFVNNPTKSLRIVVRGWPISRTIVG